MELTRYGSPIYSVEILLHPRDARFGLIRILENDQKRREYVVKREMLEQLHHQLTELLNKAPLPRDHR